MRKAVTTLLVLILHTSNVFAITKDECIDFAKFIKHSIVFEFGLLYADSNDDIASIWKSIRTFYSYDKNNKSCTVYLRYFPDELTNSIKQKLTKDGLKIIGKPMYDKITIK